MRLSPPAEKLREATAQSRTAIQRDTLQALEDSILRPQLQSIKRALERIEDSAERDRQTNTSRHNNVSRSCSPTCQPSALTCFVLILGCPFHLLSTFFLQIPISSVADTLVAGSRNFGS